MLLLATILAVSPQAQARATVRIVRAEPIGREAWLRSGGREIVMEEDGRRIRVRLVEFE